MLEVGMEGGTDTCKGLGVGRIIKPAGGDKALIRSAIPNCSLFKLIKTGCAGSVSGWKVRPASKTDWRNMGLVTNTPKKCIGCAMKKEIWFAHKR